MGEENDDLGIAMIDVKSLGGDISILIQESYHHSLRVMIHRNGVIISDYFINPNSEPFILKGIKKFWINKRRMIDE